MAVVLVTRPVLVASPLIDALQRRGHEVIHEPLLDVELVECPLPQLDEPYVVMITSQISCVCLRERGLPDVLKSRDCFCVGAQTAEEASTLGFSRVRAGEGDAYALAELVLKETSAGTNVLHIGSEHVSEGGRPLLENAGRAVEYWPVYKTTTAGNISSRLLGQLKQGAVDALFFYSVRTARTFGELLRVYGITDACSGASVIALSQPIADVLSSLGWAHIEVAATPTQNDMMRALDKALLSQGT